MQVNGNRESTMGIWACREKKLLQREHNETVQAGSDQNTSINLFHLYTEAISIQSMQSAHFHVHENCMRMMILFIQSYHIFFLYSSSWNAIANAMVQYCEFNIFQQTFEKSL